LASYLNSAGSRRDSRPTFLVATGGLVPPVAVTFLGNPARQARRGRRHQPDSQVEDRHPAVWTRLLRPALQAGVLSRTRARRNRRSKDGFAAEGDSRQT